MSSSVLKTIYNFFVYRYLYLNGLFTEFSEKSIFVEFLNKLNVKHNEIAILNLLYGRKKDKFLNVQDISEYKKLEVA